MINTALGCVTGTRSFQRFIFPWPRTPKSSKLQQSQCNTIANPHMPHSDEDCSVGAQVKANLDPQPRERVPISVKPSICKMPQLQVDHMGDA